MKTELIFKNIAELVKLTDNTIKTDHSPNIAILWRNVPLFWIIYWKLAETHLILFNNKLVFSDNKADVGCHIYSYNKYHDTTEGLSMQLLDGL